MKKASRLFQIFAKPIGPVCNLDCHYCYYLKKGSIYQNGASFRMSDDVLKAYIVGHMQAYPDSEIRFTWHGGEPTLLGLDFCRSAAGAGIYN